MNINIYLCYNLVIRLKQSSGYIPIHLNLLIPQCNKYKDGPIWIGAGSQQPQLLIFKEQGTLVILSMELTRTVTFFIVLSIIEYFGFSDGVD